MRNATPSAAEAKDFFAQFRKVREAKSKDDDDGGALAPAASSGHGAALVTQAAPKDIQSKIENELNNFVPMDMSKGTPSFRLNALRMSPKNLSPDVKLPVNSLLPAPQVQGANRVTLVLDVDETLVHSSFTRNPDTHYDLCLNIHHEGRNNEIFVKFRPFLLEFLSYIKNRFEVVIFTASLSVYCNALMDYLDPDGTLGNYRLFREHCTVRNKAYVKDLFHLGRELERTVIVDNSPVAYLFQQRNAIPIKSWFDDPEDQELCNLIPLLEKLGRCGSVYDVLDVYNASGAI